MVTRVVIEQFYENFEEATVGRWLKAEGEVVSEKEPLVELITDKATFEYESPATGTVLRLVSPEKSVVPAGYVIAVLGDPGAEIPPVETENEALLAKRKAEQEVEEAAMAASPIVRRPRSGARVRATPRARSRAREAGVELEMIAAATGAKTVTEEDVERFLAEKR